MIKRIGTPVLFSLLAFLILIVSIFRASRVHYAFSAAPITTEKSRVEIPYELPQAEVLPDNPFWPLVAAADRIWLMTNNPMERSVRELALADERLSQADDLFRGEEYEEAVTVLTKAEKYLESSYYDMDKVYLNGELKEEDLQKFLLASLKHREMVEKILFSAPEDARPIITITLNTPKTLYEKAKATAMEIGLPAPTNPFEI